MVTNGEEIQNLLDQIAQRDEVIARQAAEIIVLKQTIDALCRHIFGQSSEKLDPTHKKVAKKTRAPRITEHLSIVCEEHDPPEVLLNPEDFRRICEEVREQLGFKPLTSTTLKNAYTKPKLALPCAKPCAPPKAA